MKTTTMKTKMMATGSKHKERGMAPIKKRLLEPGAQ
jgi:hypothetical protein